MMKVYGYYAYVSVINGYIVSISRYALRERLFKEIMGMHTYCINLR